MDMVEVSFSLEPLPPLLTSISESLTLYLTSSQYDDSIGLVTMNPLYDQRLPVCPPIPDVKPTLKRKVTSPVQNSGPKKVRLSTLLDQCLILLLWFSTYFKGIIL